ncbi:MAG TPA: citryl-CoA lyase [Steroidobacteraceae bacterium]|nr:citryl-CoA lyase [Steroidobacteraceae bacterium]
MEIGRQIPSNSAISATNAEVIVVRGMDLCRDLIGKITFTDHIWLLVAGSLPTDAQRHTLDAALVAIAEHGLVPSIVAGRMTLAAAPEALQGAVAAGLLGCGSVILGAAESAARLYADIASQASRGSLDEIIRATLTEMRVAGRAIPGYGHPLHKTHDPRALRLLAVASTNRLEGKHIEIARTVEKWIPQIIGKPLVMNVSAAIGAVLLDAGYPLLAVKGVPLLARTASLVAHLLEEQERPIGFALAHSASLSVKYDGVLPPGFVPSEGA